MCIREFRVGEEMALHAVFHSAVHQLACQDYTAEQIDAWAPFVFDQLLWVQRMRAIRPFVVEVAGQVVAYADVQPSGYVDHFFVSGPFARHGIGSRLMKHLHQAANAQGITVLASDVSRTAQSFFKQFGFAVVEQRSPVIRGVVVPNALMRKDLAANQSFQGTASGGP